MEFDKLLKTMVDKGASDLFVTAGLPPSIKLNGSVMSLTSTKLTPEKCRELVLGVMNEGQRAEFLKTKELNFAISARGIGRFRCSAFYQRNLAGMVLRRIETNIPSVDSLGLPEIIKELAMTKRGLIIFVGATGAGKSTSLAAMVGHRNKNSKGHIISIEDPIEYVFRHKKSIVSQREVGIDTLSYQNALREALREAPEVIMIGEARDGETMKAAINFADTGHLCMTTLHAVNSNQAMDRIMNMFPSDRRNQLLMDLSLNLKAVISQRLVPAVDGKLACAVEVMMNSPYIAELLREGNFNEIKEIMAKGDTEGMQTFDQSLYQLYKADKITIKSALAYADSSTNLEWKINFGGEQEDQDTRHNLNQMSGGLEDLVLPSDEH